MPWLINPAQLDKFRKNQKAVIILDASWHMPEAGRDAKAEFLSKHIVGAQFFDITAFADQRTDAPHAHMLSRNVEEVSMKLSQLGIRQDYKIILYDDSKLHTACRALWMLKVFGHDPQLLYILDGGFGAWEKYNGKVESGASTVTPKSYTANFKEAYSRSLEQMKTNLSHPREQVIDVRHAVRYAGGPEIRPDVRLGHIPDSFSFPYITLFDKNNNWHSLDKIRKQLSGISIDVTSPIVTTCGSAITAPILNVALDLMGHDNHAVYNGSWSEWGYDKCYPNELSLNERPVQTSLDE